MTKAPKLYGRPIAQLLADLTDDVVGTLYQWDNGEQSKARLSDYRGKVRCLYLSAS